MIGAALLAFVVIVMAIAIRHQMRADSNRRSREWYAARDEYRQRSAPNVLKFRDRDEIRESLPRTS